MIVLVKVPWVILVICFLALLGNTVVVVAQATNNAITADKVQEQNKLNTYRDRWNSRTDNLYYDYVWSQQCLVCASTGYYPWRVQVTVTTPSGVNNKNEVPYGIRSVDSMFDEIQANLDGSTTYAFGLYDETYGYPTLYQIQQSPDEANLFTNRVTEFKVREYDRTGMYQTHRNTWASARRVNYQYTYTDYEDQGRNIAWPLTVTVQNGRVASTTDKNNQVVNYLQPYTMDEYFDHIQRYLDMGYYQAPLVLVDYVANIGYPATMDMVSRSPGPVNKTAIHSFNG